jgi:hypothetical protein
MSRLIWPYHSVRDDVAVLTQRAEEIQRENPYVLWFREEGSQYPSHSPLTSGSTPPPVVAACTFGLSPLIYPRPTDRAGPRGCRTWGTEGMVAQGGRTEAHGRWKGDDAPS